MKSAHQKIFKKPEFDFRKELKKLPVRVLLELFVVSPEDIDKLYHHFLLLNPTLHGLIPIDAFTRLPGAKENPLARRIAECLDVNDDGEVEFAEFVDGLAVFSSRCSRLEKIRFAFNIYDIDKDGYISNGELFLSLKIMSGDHLDDIQLQQVVDKTIRDADKDGDGRISFEEFVQLIEAKNSAIFEKWNLTDL